MAEVNEIVSSHIPRIVALHNREGAALVSSASSPSQTPQQAQQQRADNPFGDSIVNSISDIIFCSSGFLIAYKLKFWRSVALFAATEVILIWWVHDSLLINIIMLIHPIEAIKIWQMNL